MPTSRNNPDRRPMGRRRYRLNWDKKRSKTRIKQRAGLKARIATALRQAPGACFINGQWRFPYKYGWVEHQVRPGISRWTWERLGPLYPELVHLY